MKDYYGKIQYNGEEQTLAFNLNVMEKIQEEYGSIDTWARLTDGSSGEVNARAVIFGFTEMINEGIDIDNERNQTSKPFFTLKQVGRMITEIGLQSATSAINDTVVNSTQSTEKNA